MQNMATLVYNQGSFFSFCDTIATLLFDPLAYIKLIFTSREAAWSCRTVGRKKRIKKGLMGFWSFFVTFFLLWAGNWYILIQISLASFTWKICLQILLASFNWNFCFLLFCLLWTGNWFILVNIVSNITCKFCLQILFASLLVIFAYNFYTN